MLDLFRVHAHFVSPTEKEQGDYDPPGGRISLSDDFRSAIRDNYERAAFPEKTIIEFDFDPDERHSAARERILRYGFEDDEAADDAAAEMAEHLGEVMDQRSKPGLFVCAAGRDGNRREVTLWVFPRDSALQLRAGGEAEPSVEVLTDVFSQTSYLRKAACFAGRRVEAEFIRGRVLDRQANQSSRTVADFWIGDFLECRFGVIGVHGTRLLARTFRSALESVDSPWAREQLNAAMMAVRTRPNPNLTMRQVANDHLHGEARDAFEDALPEEPNASSVFEFDRDVFDDELNFHVYELESGVVVSVPTVEGDEGVTIDADGDQSRRLTCTGRIVNEKLRKQP